MPRHNLNDYGTQQDLTDYEAYRSAFYEYQDENLQQQQLQARLMDTTASMLATSRW